jgi:hypothetical protein
MAGARNPVRCAVDGLLIASRPQRSPALRSEGDFGGLMTPSTPRCPIEAWRNEITIIVRAMVNGRVLAARYVKD